MDTTISRASERIRFLRNECDFTFDDMAELFNVTVLTVQRWSYGEVMPSEEHMRVVDETIGKITKMRISIAGKAAFAAGYMRARWASRQSIQ